MSKFKNVDVTNALDRYFIDYVYGGEDHDPTIRDLEKQHKGMNDAVDEWYAKSKAFDELQSNLKEGKPYDDGYIGWVSSQSYDGALRKVLELTEKLKEKYEDELDDGW